jgi:hypothetical protein
MPLITLKVSLDRKNIAPAPTSCSMPRAPRAPLDDTYFGEKKKLKKVRNFPRWAS